MEKRIKFPIALVMGNVGRPSGYQKKYCKKIIDCMSNGKTITQFAASIGVHRGTIYEWQNAYPEFYDAYKKAMVKSEAYWEERMQKGDCKNPTTAIFFCKARFGWRDKQDIELRVPGKPSLTIINEK